MGEERLGQYALENLGVHLDAGHGGLDRGGLGVEEADRRGADEYQPAAHAVGVHAVFAVDWNTTPFCGARMSVRLS